MGAGGLGAMCARVIGRYPCARSIIVGGTGTVHGSSSPSPPPPFPPSAEHQVGRRQRRVRRTKEDDGCGATRAATAAGRRAEVGMGNWLALDEPRPVSASPSFFCFLSMSSSAPLEGGGGTTGNGVRLWVTIQQTARAARAAQAQTGRGGCCRYLAASKRLVTSNASQRACTRLRNARM